MLNGVADRRESQSSATPNIITCYKMSRDYAYLLQDISKRKKKLEKVASAVRLRRDGVTLNFDLLTPKSNQLNT